MDPCFVTVTGAAVACSSAPLEDASVWEEDHLQGTKVREETAAEKYIQC